jgi:arylesterase/paraoxonase
LDDGTLLVTNNHYLRAATSRLLFKIETFSGAPGGTIVSISPSSPGDAKIVARVPFANGIAKLNDSTLVVASSSKPGLYFHHFAANSSDLVFQKFVRTPAGADNLSIDGHGKVLIAGHPFVPSLIKVAEGRPGCDEDGTMEHRKACGCWAPSWVGEWSEEGGLKTLMRDGGGEVCSSSTAVRDVRKGIGMVSMLYGKGLVVFRE